MKRLNILSIAGDDPSGGAGIQADLKTFSALKAYGTSVITALTAQNTHGVKGVYSIEPYFIAMQLDSILSDIRIDSMKIGMLSNNSIIDIVSQKIQVNKIPFVILDPVIISKNGYQLLSEDSIHNICIKLFPYVSIITPNIFEAASLLKTTVAKSETEILEQGQSLLNFGCKAVLITGGHINSHICTDWLITKLENKCFSLPRVKTLNTHGTGCSLSSALAALRPRYKNWTDTIIAAKNWLQIALKKADTLEVGTGIGPIHHFHKWW